MSPHNMPMEADSEADVQHYPFLTLAPDTGEWSSPCHGHSSQAPVRSVWRTSWVPGPFWMDSYGEKKLYCPQQGSNPGLSQHVAKITLFSDPLLCTNSISTQSSFHQKQTQVLHIARVVTVEMHTALHSKCEGRVMIYCHIKFTSFSSYNHQTQHYMQISQSHQVQF
jgi:hypothetical protein